MLRIVKFRSDRIFDHNVCKPGLKEKTLPRGAQIRNKKFLIDWESRKPVQLVEQKGKQNIISAGASKIPA